MKTLLNKERVVRACQAADAKGSKNSFWLVSWGGGLFAGCVENSDRLVGSGAFQLDLEQENLGQVPRTA